MKAVIYALPSACAGGIQTRLNDLLNWKEKTVSCVPPCYDGTYFRERNGRCPLGNTPQVFSWGVSRRHKLHIIRFRCDASSHTILRFCGNPVLLLVASAASRTAGSGLLDGLVASTAGRTAGSRLLSGLVASAAGRTAGSGFLGGLVASAAGRTAGSGFLGRLVTGAAGGGRSGVRLLVPAKEIGKRHID